MRAAVFHGPRDVRIENVPDPARPRPDEVVLEVIRAAICGTDAAEWDHGPVLCRPGVVLGHEFVGRVVETRQRRHGPARRRPGRLGCGNLVRSLPLVPRRSHEPVRRVPHARPPGRRRPRRVRDVAGIDLPSRSRRVRRRRGRDDPAARRRPPRSLPGRAGPGRRRRGDRRRRDRLVHRRGRLASGSRTGAWSRSTSTTSGCRRRRALGADETANATGRDLAELLLELTDGVGFDIVIEATRRARRASRGDRGRAPRWPSAPRRPARRAARRSTSRR